LIRDYKLFKTLSNLPASRLTEKNKFKKLLQKNISKPDCGYLKEEWKFFNAENFERLY